MGGATKWDASCTNHATRHRILHDMVPYAIAVWLGIYRCACLYAIVAMRGWSCAWVVMRMVGHAHGCMMNEVGVRTSVAILLEKFRLIFVHEGEGFWAWSTPLPG